MVLTHGVGTKVYDTQGREYLDMAAGIAVNALGHSDPRWYDAVVEQAKKLAHTSNLYHTVPQVSAETSTWKYNFHHMKTQCSLFDEWMYCYTQECTMFCWSTNGSKVILMGLECSCA